MTVFYFFATPFLSDFGSFGNPLLRLVQDLSIIICLVVNTSPSLHHYAKSRGRSETLLGSNS